MPPSEKPKRGDDAIRVFSMHPYGAPDVNRLKKTARRVLEGESWDFRVDIIIADDPELRRLNRLFLGEDEATDVMAFPGEAESEIAPDSGNEKIKSEVYISLDQARAQAAESGESVQKAVERLLVHGILHLGGWRDGTESERDRMLEHGNRYLKD